jgi:hypothetical protein
VYPLEEFTGEMLIKDWADVPSFDAGLRTGGGETKWVRPETFFGQLGEVLRTVPPQGGEQALYAQFGALLDAGRRDPQIRQQADKAFTEADAAFAANAMLWKYNGAEAGNGWNRPVNNSQWGLDYHNRAATARSNMFENRPGETQYFYTDTDAEGGQLTGDHTYQVTFGPGGLPPVAGFWSLTMYNEDHFFYPNDLRRYSLGTKNKLLTYGPDGSLSLYAGHTSPGPDHESNWLPAPDGTFSRYLRAYGGQTGITGGTWTPPVITKQ